MPSMIFLPANFFCSFFLKIAVQCYNNCRRLHTSSMSKIDFNKRTSRCFGSTQLSVTWLTASPLTTNGQTFPCFEFHLSEPIKLSKLYSVSYCSSSHNSPRFSITALSELLPASLCCCAGVFSFFFSLSTENRSSSCPVPMVDRLVFSCEITVLAMFSLNF